MDNAHTPLETTAVVEPTAETTAVVDDGAAVVAAAAATPADEPEIEQPLIRFDLYPSVILMTQYRDEAVATYPVAALDVAAAWSQVSANSGFLPANALFWRRRGGLDALGVFVPARRWNVQSADGSFHLPLPPLLFMGQGRHYAVFALKRRPKSAAADLFHAPFPNVFPSGQICPGDVPFPTCSAETIYDALALFLEGSRFNRHLSQNRCRSFPDDVYRLWRALDGKARFPLVQLLPLYKQLSALL
jgi:PRTRC genetic system protein B